MTWQTNIQKIAEKEMEDRGNDPSHDYAHACNVLDSCQKIAAVEGGDMEILMPAALFHDVVIYPKNHPNSDNAAQESAGAARAILQDQAGYPPDKVEAVVECIKSCSFSKQDEPKTIEIAILRDADRLAATGAIAIMRTFASSGQMQRPLYNREDPFAVTRETDAKKYALDLFYERLLIARDRMYTQTAKDLAKERTEFLKSFLTQLETELK